MAAFDEGKSWIALLAGIIVLALGGIPLLSGFIGFNLPGFILSILPSIAVWVIVAAGFLLFIDAFWEYDHMRAVGVIVGILLVGVGVVQILINFGMVSWTFTLISPLVSQILLSVEGLGLIIASFAME